MPSRRALIGLGLLGVAGSALATVPFLTSDDEDTTEPQPKRVNRHFVEQLRNTHQFEQLGGPDRTVIRSGSGALVAELTHGSRTVRVTGPTRTFVEPASTKAKIVTNSWVHIADKPFDPRLLADETFAGWLLARLDKTMQDVLGCALDYITDAPARITDNIRVAGDAKFGYINEDSTRDGADFYDYLEIPWTWPDGTQSRPAAKWRRSLDCSGYLRLVYGYRMGMTLHRGNARVTEGLPRTAYAIAERAPSTLIAEAAEPDQAPRDLSKVAAGDLVFFALHAEDPGLITHSGIVLGPDTDGDLRFVSSRQTIDGPTFGDVAGAGVLNVGFFAERLRKIIRL